MLLSDVSHHQQRLAPRALYLQTVGTVYPGKIEEEECSAVAIVFWGGNQCSSDQLAGEDGGRQ